MMSLGPYRRMQLHFAKVSSQRPHDGDADRTIGQHGATFRRSGQARSRLLTEMGSSSSVRLVRKGHLAPVHTTTQAALRRYGRERDTVFSRPKDEAFFLSSQGCRLSAAGLLSNLAKARKLAGLDDGKPLRPHDLRHRFAVTRLGLWHQQRADVQTLLPLHTLLHHRFDLGTKGLARGVA